MKIALVHDWLNQKAGGAERVLAELADIFPEAPIYTMIYNSDLFGYDEERIHTSYLQSAPDFIKKRSRYLLPFIPNAIESWDFSDYDVVLSSSCAFAKNIVTGDNTVHICYCHSPMRFAWDYWPRYLDEQSLGPIRRSVVRNMVRKLRIWDLAGASRVDVFIANSKTTRARINKYYRRKSILIYPPVDTKAKLKPKQDYYVTLGMLTPYKMIDLAVEAFSISGKKLKVVGDGPERKRLENMAAENVEFLGFVDDTERFEILAGARGLIFPNVEDFGIVPVEAMACGTPVIAYGQGGVTETVIDKRTGVLFNDQTPKGLNQAINTAESIAFDANELQERAKSFSAEQFRSAIKKLIDKYAS